VGTWLKPAPPLEDNTMSLLKMRTLDQSDRGSTSHLAPARSALPLEVTPTPVLLCLVFCWSPAMEASQAHAPSVKSPHKFSALAVNKSTKAKQSYLSAHVSRHLSFILTLTFNLELLENIGKSKTFVIMRHLTSRQGRPCRCRYITGRCGYSVLGECRMQPRASRRRNLLGRTASLGQPASPKPYFLELHR
jgi:hypothetical protein